MSTSVQDLPDSRENHTKVPQLVAGTQCPENQALLVKEPDKPKTEKPHVLWKTNCPKGITITFVPDWLHSELEAVSKPVTVSIVFGPKGTLPQQSQWCFEFSVFCSKSGAEALEHSKDMPGGAPQLLEFKEKRVLLWYNDKPYPPFADALNPKGCTLRAENDLKTVLMCMRTHMDEKHDKALMYVPGRHQIGDGLQCRSNGYFKMIYRHHYFLTMMFDTGSTIGALVEKHGWCPSIYLTSKNDDGTNRVSRLFTHFNTNWQQGVTDLRLTSEEMWQGLIDSRAPLARCSGKSAGQGPPERSLDCANLLDSTLKASNLVHVSEATKTLEDNIPKVPLPPGPWTMVETKPDDASGDTKMVVTQVEPRTTKEQFIHDVLVRQHEQQQRQLLKQFREQYARERALLEKRMREQVVRPVLTQAQLWFLSQPQNAAKTMPDSIVPLITGPPSPSLSLDLSMNAAMDIQLKSRVLTVIPEHSLRQPAPPLPPVKNMAELEKQLETQPLEAITLPPLLDNEKYDYPLSKEISYEPTIQSFDRASILSKAMSAIDRHARILRLEPKTRLTDTARHILAFFGHMNDLYGWQHVSWYLYNVPTTDEKTETTETKPTVMDICQTQGQQIMRRLFQRVEWILFIQEKRPFTAEQALKILACDRVWATDADVFMRQSESHVTEMLVSHQTKFQEYREEKRKGVSWPHSPEYRKYIEACGFVHRPMMIRMDRCVCETCGAEVTGWRPWHDPVSFHFTYRHDSRSAFASPTPLSELEKSVLANANLSFSLF